MKYAVIYADPPWSYSSKQDQHSGKPTHYSTLSVAELCRLPVASLAAPRAALFLWTTPPCLREALMVAEAWGFAYKTKAFCWVKKNKVAPSLFWGQGYYTRSNTEDCWLCTRGGGLKRVSASVHQVVHTPVRRHSQKPDEVRHRIERLFGDVPRIELFARERVPGWHAWGNEVPCSVKLRSP